MNNKNWIAPKKNVNCCSFVKEYSFDKPVKDISINITAMGWYHLYINEERIDQDVFSPGWTDYKKMDFATKLYKDTLCMPSAEESCMTPLLREIFLRRRIT